MSETVYDISDDSVMINIFSTQSNCDAGFWKKICEDVNITLKTLSFDYIWHRDELKFYIPITSSDHNASSMHLTSTVCFGDNIEDEWYVVYLVLELSKIYEDLIIQVVDSDGDFLLIEAANYLPPWANPGNTFNRVFIYNNQIHIIPPKVAELKNRLEVKDAIKFISNYSEQTKASTDIQKAIQSRVGQYPKKVEENFHQAIVKLPLDIATLLTLQPSLIAPIVTTYCGRDAIDTKYCKILENTEHIPVEVKFTKCLYAMLMHSKTIRHDKNNFTKNHKSDVLGIKLTCGYQMMMKMFTEDLFHTKEYRSFEKNLKINGYFRNNVENSLEYKHLLDGAKKYFLDVECPQNLCISKKISELISTDRFLKLRETLIHQNKQENDLKEDSDEWLNINPNELNELLNSRYGGNDMNFENDDVIAPDTIKSKLTDFLKKSSDFEGVDTSHADNSESDYINFDANEFENCLEKIMNFLSSDVNEINLQSDSDIESESDIDEELNCELDKQLAENLNCFEKDRSNPKSVAFNLTQSIKEEGISGPSSNLLTSVGIKKTDLLDSDDE